MEDDRPQQRGQAHVQGEQVDGWSPKAGHQVDSFLLPRYSSGGAGRCRKRGRKSGGRRKDSGKEGATS